MAGYGDPALQEAAVPSMQAEACGTRGSGAGWEPAPPEGMGNRVQDDTVDRLQRGRCGCGAMGCGAMGGGRRHRGY